MRSGTLRHRITIQSLTTVQDQYGDPVETWSTFATVSAAVEPLVGREYFTAGQMTSSVGYRVRVRYLAGLLPTMRILHSGLTLEVKAVLPLLDRDKETHLMCEVIE